MDGSSLDVYIMIIWSVWTHLSEDERRVEFKIDLSRANSSQWRRPAAERPVTGLLGRGIHGLPATHTRRQIRTGHPAVVPHMEVPAGHQKKTEEIMVSERLHKTMSNDIPIQQQSWKCTNPHHTESELRWWIGSIFSSKYTSVVKDTSVSWADWKLVTERVGIPRHLSTGTDGEREHEFSNFCRYSI